MENKYTFFWKTDEYHGAFSQWYLGASFVVAGVTYNCAEQFMMHMKAVLFGDKETALKIMAAKKPYEQKALGKEVKNFDKKKWDRACFEIVYQGNLAKFSQNPELKKLLLGTNKTELVEASPKDNIWGIGLAAEDPRALDPAQWLGQNLLGKVLTTLRDDMVEGFRSVCTGHDYEYCSEYFGNQKNCRYCTKIEL